MAGTGTFLSRFRCVIGEFDTTAGGQLTRNRQRYILLVCCRLFEAYAGAQEKDFDYAQLLSCLPYP